jgi:hypothetical protein
MWATQTIMAVDQSESIRCKNQSARNTNFLLGTKMTKVKYKEGKRIKIGREGEKEKKNFKKWRNPESNRTPFPCLSAKGMSYH